MIDEGGRPRPRVHAMNIAFACPKCEETTQADFTPETRELACAHCDFRQVVPEGTVTDDRLHRCLVCQSGELFVRKNFSQTLGVTIIVVGFIASTITWAYYWRFATYGILFGTALLDVILYCVVGNLLECYRCHAQYRDLPGLEKYEPFNLEVHEKYRQQAIRLQEAERAARASNRLS